MPIYEFRCQRCEARFEVRRPMREAGAPTRCPDGHAEVTRLLPMFATTGLAQPAAQGCGTGSGCCGGACGAA